MSRVEINIPRHIHNRMLMLSKLSQETKGWLVYLKRPHGRVKRLAVQALVMTGRGEAHHVGVHPVYHQVAGLFLDALQHIDPDYGYLAWHTHPTFPYFSQTDRKNLAQLLELNPDYIMMMVHRDRQLALGRPGNEHDILIVPSTPTHIQNDARLMAIYKNVIQLSGVVLPRINATWRPT